MGRWEKSAGISDIDIMAEKRSALNDHEQGQRSVIQETSGEKKKKEKRTNR